MECLYSSGMRFWWVNQNQTFEQEFRGGYLWSPKRNRNGARNQFYENMRGVTPGDVVFSFRNRTIAAIGVAQSYGYECPKPTEFGSIGANWETIGWRVDVAYTTPHSRIVPKEHMGLLGPLMPERYAPLQKNGDGIQNIYLAEIPYAFADALAGLIGVEARELVGTARSSHLMTAPQLAARGIDEWEEKIQASITANKAIPETERTAIIRARRGQGLFKQNVMRIEMTCRITKVDNPAHLVGSHIKPWRDSENAERLDGENGLLLTPSIDHLFDRGFISFKNDGAVLISPVADERSLKRMGVEAGMGAGEFSRGQRGYLEFHRDEVFLTAEQTRP
jgi:putative restriction endonuclease